MTPEPAPQPPPLRPPTFDEQLGVTAPPPMSEGARLAGVFFSPGTAFADIARRPRWWIPVILSAILSTVFLNVFTSRVGWEQTIRQAMEQSPQIRDMPVQQREQTIRTMANIYKYVGYAGGLLGLVSVFVVSVVLLLVFDTILGSDIGLKRFMGVVAYAYLPMMIYTALSLVVLLLKNPEDFDLQNPLMFNVGAFLSQDSSAWLRRLGSSLDLFSFWVMTLLAIGIVAAARKKLTFGKAFAGVAFPWMLYVALTTGLAAMNGR
jgi:hypothetical protein